VRSFLLSFLVIFLSVMQMAGPSMMPTFSNAFQLVLEDRLSVRLSLHNIKRGDLVTFLSVYDPKKSVCKRVIGLPGDIICVFPEKAIAIASASASSSDDEVNQVEHIVVPRGHVWLSGDNLSNSRDSSEFGPIPMGLIQGKIVAKVRMATL
jgi:inner membrane protease subunit 1